ncbi:MAG: phosphotransferase [Bacteroidales bacterium]|nr:phosphotransferase [Bacteroidales bacterium]
MEQLKQLFAQWAGEPCAECLAIGAGGSARRYFRLVGATRRCVGAVADDIRENEAFFAFSRHLHAKHMPVPELYAVADDRCHYLQQDLGDQTLYGMLFDKKRQGGGFDAEMLTLYKQALADLAAIQQAGADIDFSVAYPRAAFDRRSILWDLNYFKYYFLKLKHVPFDEELLQNDFDRLADSLLAADCNYFLYRDFNPRNIMVADRLYYIDYQGGRRGAAQYDVASLLYSAKSDLPEAIRAELLSHYLDVRNLKGDARKLWLDDFWRYLLVRILQTLGAYGYRGLYERKPYFIESIPLALTNLRTLIENHPLLLSPLPELARALSNSLNSPNSLNSLNSLTPLTVTVTSFSFKQGLPDDPSGNGGGHIFDCRALPNPGRYSEYKTYTCKDRPVIEFLQRKPAVDLFLNNVKGIVAQSVDKYLERHFTNLMVSFGCTGGQHRSVYFAEQTAAWLRQTYPMVNVVLCHREQDK